MTLNKYIIGTVDETMCAKLKKMYTTKCY